MREPTLLRTFLLLIPPSLLLIACVVAFALERISYGIFADNIPSLNYGRGGRTMTFYGPPFKHATKYEYMEVEIEINVAPTATIIGLTLLGVMVAGVGACGVWELRRVVGTAAHQRAWAWQVCILQVLYAGACVGVLAWVTLVQGEGWKDYRDVEGMGDVQKFTRETWVCQIDQFFPLNDWSASACGVAKAARFMLIPLAISALSIVGSIGVLVHGRGGFRWFFGGKGRYAAFSSLYEMTAQTPVVRPAVVR